MDTALKIDLHRFARGKYGPKSANEWEIKGKDGKYRNCIPVYIGLEIRGQRRYLPSLPFV